MKLITIIVILFSIASITTASNLDKVKKAIKEKDAKWQAGETSMSVLSVREQKARLGAVVAPPRNDKSNSKGKPRLPKNWDWRDAYGTWVTPVKNQGACGSCWAFGSVAQLESVKMIAEGVPDPDLDLSEQYIVSCDPNNFGCRGGYMYQAYNFLRDVGVPDEGCFPYQGQDLPCAEACENPALVNITGWSPIAYNVNRLKAAVYEHPITVAFYVMQDFFYYTGGVYKYVWGDLLGGHAVCIVGWSHKGHYFIVKNSWGTGWGEDGYFNIAFSQVDADCPVRFGMQAGNFEMALAAPARNETLVTVWAEVKL